MKNASIITVFCTFFAGLMLVNGVYAVGFGAAGVGANVLTGTNGNSIPKQIKTAYTNGPNLPVVPIGYIYATGNVDMTTSALKNSNYVVIAASNASTTGTPCATGTYPAVGLSLNQVGTSASPAIDVIQLDALGGGGGNTVSNTSDDSNNFNLTPTWDTTNKQYEIYIYADTFAGGTGTSNENTNIKFTWTLVCMSASSYNDLYGGDESGICEHSYNNGSC